MKISGFTFIRNGNLLDYPYIEAILSVLPICDEMVVVVGKSEDGTREKIAALENTKIRIIDTEWDEGMREGGKILAFQTNIALQNIKGDWGFYIQGDEVLHEKYLGTVKIAMEKYLTDEKVEGLLFQYKHFYGSYEFIGDSPKWYRKEIRVIRNYRNILSYKDAQGFRREGRKLGVKEINAEIFHYGWVRNPRAQQLKQESFHKYWHNDDWVKEHVVHASEADYNLFESLQQFNGTHPQVMKERIKNMSWKYEYNPSKKKATFKELIKIALEKITGIRVGEYKNYKII